MSKVDELAAVVDGLRFRKHEYSEAEQQLIGFANSYSKLDPDSADQLRERFDGKERLGLFRVASSLFRNSFLNAGKIQKKRLCRIFFAMYSFDNLGFGYDSVLDVIDISKLLHDYDQLARDEWLPFKSLTTNQTAQRNLENHLFGHTNPST